MHWAFCHREVPWMDVIRASGKLWASTNRQFKRWSRTNATWLKVELTIFRGFRCSSREDHGDVVNHWNQNFPHLSEYQRSFQPQASKVLCNLCPIQVLNWMRNKPSRTSSLQKKKSHVLRLVKDIVWCSIATHKSQLLLQWCMYLDSCQRIL